MSTTRTWRPAWPCPVEQVWSTWRRGSGDPTYRIVAGRHWRGLLTPDGAATLAVDPDAAAGTIDAEAWGPGSDWALSHLPAMLGADDDDEGFATHHDALAAARRANPHWRVGRGGSVWQALLPAIVEQKVTGHEAFGGYRRLVRRFGEPAPGPGSASRFAPAPTPRSTPSPGADRDLFVPPTPDAVRAIPSWEWLRCGIDGARSRTAVTAAGVADALERTLALPHAEADRRLRALPGIGVWTSAEVRSRAHGDPDAVAFGDYHVARNIGWALIGVEVDDDGLADLLEPYRGHRYRVQRLLELSGPGHPRFGPRMAPRTHLPTSDR